MPERKLLKILLIEDDADDILLFKLELLKRKPAGLQLDYAGSLPAGIEKLLNTHYDAVLVDYGIDGSLSPDLARKIHSHGKAVPVILLHEEWLGSEEVAAALQAGAGLCVTKSAAISPRLEQIIQAAIHSQAVLYT